MQQPITVQIWTSHMTSQNGVCNLHIQYVVARCSPSFASSSRDHVTCFLDYYWCRSRAQRSAVPPSGIMGAWNQPYIRCFLLADGIGWYDHQGPVGVSPNEFLWSNVEWGSTVSTDPESRIATSKSPPYSTVLHLSPA